MVEILYGVSVGLVLFTLVGALFFWGLRGRRQTSAAYRANVGALLLDRTTPGWFRLIDLNTLKVDDCGRCIIGQLFGWFNTYGIQRAGGYQVERSRVLPKTLNYARTYGFAPEDVDDAKRLDVAWSYEVHRRRNSWPI